MAFIPNQYLALALKSSKLSQLSFLKLFFPKEFFYEEILLFFLLDIRKFDCLKLASETCQVRRQWETYTLEGMAHGSIFFSTFLNQFFVSLFTPKRLIAKNSLMVLQNFFEAPPFWLLFVSFNYYIFYSMFLIHHYHF